MKYSVDFVEPGHAFVNGDSPLEEPCLLFRDDRRSIIGEDIHGNLVVLQSEEKSKVMTQIDFDNLVELNSNITEGIADIKSNAPLTAYKVRVDGVDAEYLFIEKGATSADAVKGFTNIDVGSDHIAQAIATYNKSQFPDPNNTSDIEQSATQQQVMMR